TLIGVLEVAGGVGLVIPKLTRSAILGLTGIMIGAVYTHVANGEGAQLVRPVLFTVLMYTAGWLRGTGPLKRA
ncbi:MAG: DoxX family protein, partial [Phycisphaerales bacterium]|nr:DoxX family protein [Phycisphaerales bacterium]